jgi:hypothetical protein
MNGWNYKENLKSLDGSGWRQKSFIKTNKRESSERIWSFRRSK